MKHYLVALMVRGVVEQFICQADDSMHAIEQAKNAYPDMNKLLLVRPAKPSDFATTIS